MNPGVIAAGDGGFITAWHDGRDGIQKIYVQKIDARGNTLWERDGVLVFDSLANMYNHGIAPDGSGGAFVVCSSEALGPYGQDIYLQRIDAQGNDAWGWGGYFMTYSTGDQQFPDICIDGSGGAYLVWQDHRGSSWDIYASHITHDGITDWPADGRAVCVSAGDQMFCSVVYDQQGCAVVTWRDTRTDDGDIYAQKFDLDGDMLWASNGVAVCNSGYMQAQPDIVSDVGGNTVIVWSDYRNNADLNIYAQKYDPDGLFQWAPGGVVICDASGNQEDPNIVSDGAGGAFITWTDYRGVDLDIYALRVLADGHVVWGADGIPVCTESDNQFVQAIDTDGDEGVYISWSDYRTGSPRVYMQHLNRASDDLWGTNGMLIGIDTYSTFPSLVSDGQGGVVVSYYDHRTGAYYGVYAERFNFDGDWGVPEPEINAVIDVPLDEGGYVNLSWQASDHDRTAEITHYSLWRAISQSQALLAFDSGVRLLDSVSRFDPDVDGKVIREELRGSSIFYWEYIWWVDAVHIDTYSETVSTLFDSTGTYVPYHYFQVIAHTADELTFWVSEPDSGYSVDNLAPAMPSGFIGEPDYNPPAVTLSWEPNTEADFACYRLYRGEDAGFIPSGATLVATTTETEYFDDHESWSSAIYKLTAVDIHGNESLVAVLGSEQVTGEGTPPAGTFLAQNYPNPFNPSTEIVFGLKEQCEVSLKVYDVAGKLLATLVQGPQPAGIFSARWNGQGPDGRRVASGIYFYRLVAGNETISKKMAMLR